MYLNVRTRHYPITLDGIRQTNPHVSFPASGPDADTLTSLGYVEVVATDAPTITGAQRLVEGPPELVDGRWRQVWTVAGRPGEEVAMELAAAKAAAFSRIDTQAEALRGTVLTPGSGQMAAYQGKEAQAAALLRDPTPTEGEYPDLFNEIGITADSAVGVASAVLTAAEKWRLFGRAVEKARLSGKKAVSAATDVAGVEAAEAAVSWPETGSAA